MAKTMTGKDLKTFWSTCQESVMNLSTADCLSMSMCLFLGERESCLFRWIKGSATTFEGSRRFTPAERKVEECRVSLAPLSFPEICQLESVELSHAPWDVFGQREQNSVHVQKERLQYWLWQWTCFFSHLSRLPPLYLNGSNYRHLTSQLEEDRVRRKWNINLTSSD